VTQLRILLETDRLIAVEKPSGTLVHQTTLAPRTEPSLQQRLRDQIGAWVQPVHRLDRSASGVMLFSKDTEATAELMELFRERRVEKVYHAVVRGWPPETLTIDRPLTVRPDLRKKDRPQKEPQTALTHIRRLGTVELPFAVSKFPTTRYALVEARIETGRLHQIRRHLQGANHPIIGDSSYGEGKHNRFWREQYGISRLLLFARRLAFTWREHRYDIECPLPSEVEARLLEWGWPTGA
jgi:tRNA pseudouridine65 synthase